MLKWHRVRDRDKLAFREDLQADPTLTDLQKRMVSIIAQHWDNTTMRAECSLTFIAAGAGTTKKMVAKYAQSLIDSGRVTKERKPTYTTSALWAVNWWFRGAAWIRHSNGGQPILDCRRESPKSAHWGESPNGTSPPAVPVPQAGDQFLPNGRDRRPKGARPIKDAQGAPEEKKSNPRKMAGFAKWKIVHAEYVSSDGKPSDEGETFVAHLRSGSNRKFHLRCHIDDDAYGSINDALSIDGEPENVIGEMVMMSTNRSGTKEFRRSGPSPWVSVTIVSVEQDDAGNAAMQVIFSDTKKAGRILLSPAQAMALSEACGGEAKAIGARVRYRVMPDDSFEFRTVQHSEDEAA